MNKRLVLLLILALTVAILGGCAKQIKAPEGVRQEFYDELINYLYHAEEVKGEITLEKRKEIIDFVDSEALFPMEEDMGESMTTLYKRLWLYYTMSEDEPDIEVVEEYIYNALVKLEVDVDIIDISKITKK